MPRALGQVDLKKSEAMLDAAIEVFAERGFNASIEEIARRAGVSKQTVYNRFGGKEELLRAIVERKRGQLTSLLASPPADEPLEDTLARYIGTILRLHLQKTHCNMMRLAIATASELPDATRIIFETGPKEGRRQLAHFLARETIRGRLRVENPEEAAEILAGMAAGQVQMRSLLGVSQDLQDADVDPRAREVARRFIRAYAP